MWSLEVRHLSCLVILSPSPLLSSHPSLSFFPLLSSSLLSSPPFHSLLSFIHLFFYTGNQQEFFFFFLSALFVFLELGRDPTGKAGGRSHLWVSYFSLCPCQSHCLFVLFGEIYVRTPGLFWRRLWRGRGAVSQCRVLNDAVLKSRSCFM